MHSGALMYDCPGGGFILKVVLDLGQRVDFGGLG